MAGLGRKWKVKHGPCTYTGGVPKKGILRRTSRYATEARDDGAREEDASQAPTEEPKKQEKPKKPKKSKKPKSPMAATTTTEAGSPPPSSSLIKRARAARRARAPDGGGDVGGRGAH